MLSRAEAPIRAIAGALGSPNPGSGEIFRHPWNRALFLPGKGNADRVRRRSSHKSSDYPSTESNTRPRVARHPTAKRRPLRYSRCEVSHPRLESRTRSTHRTFLSHPSTRANISSKWPSQSSANIGGKRSPLSPTFTFRSRPHAVNPLHLLSHEPRANSRRIDARKPHGLSHVSRARAPSSVRLMRLMQLSHMGDAEILRNRSAGRLPQCRSAEQNTPCFLALEACRVNLGMDDALSFSRT